MQPPERHDYRDWFDIQLRLAEAVEIRTTATIDEAVFKYTNLYRRFGFGMPDNVDPRWRVYSKRLATCTSHAQRLDWTLEFRTGCPYEHHTCPERIFGCFGFDVAPSSTIVRIHFYNHDAAGPLAEARLAARTGELHRMFRFIRQQYPGARTVEGRSWLYGIDAYRRLYPPVYRANPVVYEKDLVFQGNSRWGQFLDRHGATKPDLHSKFLDNLESFDVRRPWRTFPLLTYSVSGPVSAFYRHFGIDHATYRANEPL